MERLPKMWRSALAMILAVCMVIGFCPVAAFATGADEDVLNYVSFGASNANGYGLEGYMPANVTAERIDQGDGFIVCIACCQCLRLC